MKKKKGIEREYLVIVYYWILYTKTTIGGYHAGGCKP